MKLIVSIDQVKTPITGTGRYTYELVSELNRLPQIESIKYFRGVNFDTDLIRKRGSKSNLSHVASQYLTHPRFINLYQKVTAFRQGRSLRGFEDYLFHGTSFYLPPFFGRSVVTIHDISTFILPECHPPERVRYMDSQVKLSLERASVLITVSEFTRLEVARYFGKRLEDIYAIPNASGPSFYPREKRQVEFFLNKFELGFKAYSLFVGTIEPRKNLLVLLAAYELLPLRIRKQWPLVITGYKGWRSDDIHEKISRAIQDGWAKYLGFVDDVELPLLYAGARLFIFPSLYEGFGLPVLEAFSSGIPVVCSNTSSLPEIAEGVALMCEPKDIEGMSSLIEKGLENEVWQSQAVSAGLVRARNYSWRQCAQQTAEVYEHVLKR